MEAATASVAAARGGGSTSLPMPSLRREWRAVSEHHHHQHHSVRNAGEEELERSRMGQSDERTMYEVQHGREPADVDFCSITVDGSLDSEILQERVQSIERQREELLLMEVELRAQMIARNEIMELQNSFDAQLKEHEDAAVRLQEQLREKEQTIHDLERRMEEKERELHAIKLDSEASWAKEDLLREQTKELATFRRERDHSEAEKAQHIQQIRDLQEHVQGKERQFLELQEQHRNGQENIFLKDEQLQAWISRVQEMDALHSTTNHSLQAELQERTEQCNQLWLGCQRQFVEMERLHYAVQQLQVELADAREKRGSYSEDSHVSQTNSKDVPKFVHHNGNPQEVNGSNASNADNGAIQNSNSDNPSPFTSAVDASGQTNHVASVPIPPSSLLGMPTYLPPGQMTALHPFILHQQGISHSMPSHSSQSHVGHFHPAPAISSLPQWQNQKNQLEASQTDQNIMGLDGKYEYETSANGHGFSPNYMNVHVTYSPEQDTVTASSAGESQAVESINQSYLVAPPMDHGVQQISSQFTASLNLNSFEQNSETKGQNVLDLGNEMLEGESLAEEEAGIAANASLSETSVHSANLNETTINNGAVTIMSEAFASTGQPNMVTVGKTPEAASLLDERSLLACIVRTIPAGGRIRINSTLPNRLSKMLAPLHWHDYKKKYGKLDDFVAGHPKLFLIEGDYIQLREGAQEMIAATAAVAKVAAANAASAPCSSFLPSVAVTPMAQSRRLKKVPSVDSRHQNGLGYGATGGISNVMILSKSKDSQQGRTTGAVLTSRT